MLPIEPLTVMVVVDPLQTVAAAAAAVPPTLSGLTVTNELLLTAEAQTPLVTSALYYVLVVKLGVVYVSVVPPVPPDTIAQPLFPVLDCCH